MARNISPPRATARPWFVGFVLAVVAAFFGTMAPSPAVAGPGDYHDLTGRVVDLAGAPVTTAAVQVYRRSDDGTGGSSWDVVADAQVAYDGTFDVGLLDGQYRVWAYDTEWALRSEYFDNKFAFGNATVITVSGGSLALPDIVLGTDESHLVQGIATDSDGNPLGNAEVRAEAYDAELGNAYVNSAWTDDSGAYAMSLPGGQYQFGFTSYDGYNAEWYNDQPSSATADVVDVVDDDVTLLPVALEHQATVTGKVVDAMGSPVASVRVEAYGLIPGGDPELTDATYTDWDGVFTFDNGLPSGDYTFSFSDEEESRFVTEWYDDQVDMYTADPVSVPRTGVVTLHDVVVTQGSTISGHVTTSTGAPIKRIAVRVYSLGYDEVGSAVTDSSGAYAVGRVPGDTYKVEFYDPYSGFVGEFYNNKADFDSGTPIVVDKDSKVAGIDAELADGGTVEPPGVEVAGKVTNKSGEPLMGISVDVRSVDDSEVGQWAMTDRQGRYFIDGLPTGSYKVDFWDENADSGDLAFVSEYWDNEVSWDSATVVHLVKDARTVLSPVLAQNATVTGKIIDESTKSPVRFAEVQAYDVDGELTDIASTDASGAYRFQGLAPGTYRLKFSGYGEGPDNEFSYVREWWNDKVSFQGATPVTLGSGQVKTGVNAALTDRLVAVGPPTVTGRPVVGATLTASAGTWNLMSQARYTFTWWQGDTKIGTGSTYQLSLADAGRACVLRVDARVFDKTGRAFAAPTAVVKSASSVSMTGTSPQAHGATLTVVIKVPGVANPGGIVTVRSGKVVRKGVPVVGGKATVTLTGLTSGRHTFIATYSGTSKVLGGTSPKVVVKVK